MIVKSDNRKDETFILSMVNEIKTLIKLINYFEAIRIIDRKQELRQTLHNLLLKCIDLNAKEVEMEASRRGEYCAGP